MDIAFIISYSVLGLLVVSTLILLFCWKNDYLIYNRRFLFVIGLMFSRFLTDSAIIDVLMWLLTYHGGSLVTSAVLSNLQKSLSSLFLIFMANIADSVIGRFRTLCLLSISYMGGLLIFWIFHPYNVVWLLVVALVLLALGTSGTSLLQNVLIQLVYDTDNSQDRTKERSQTRAEMWSFVTLAFASISAILWVTYDAVGGVLPSWRISFLICLIAMTVTFMIFCIGHKFYRHDLTERPIGIFIRLLRAPIQNLYNPWSSTIASRQSTRSLGTELGENEISRQERSLRLDTIRQEYRGEVENIVVLKSLLKMVPIWALYIVVCLVSATGSTFFFEQYSDLKADDSIPIQIYSLAQTFSSFAIKFLFYLISRGGCRICGVFKNVKVKIGAGMLCGIISCVFAWQLEVQRLKVVYHNQVNEDASKSLSFLWLLPQFCMLGCMEGLTNNGLLKFFKSQVKYERIQRYGEEYQEFVVGLGHSMNIFLILIFRLVWFGDDINNSRIDKYYLVLVCVSSANFIIYCFVATYFYKDAGKREDDGDDGLQQYQLQLLPNHRIEQDHLCLANTMIDNMIASP